MEIFDKAREYLSSPEFVMKTRNATYDDNKYQFTPEQIVNTWHLDLANDYDLVVAITGYEGSGKSTFAIMLAEIAKNKLGYDYTFPKNPREFLDALNNESIKLIIIDEAVANLYSRNAMSKENKQFVTLLTMCRSKNKIMLFLIPRLRNIDLYMRGDRIFQWIEIRSRDSNTNTGTAMWFMRDMNDFANVETFDMKLISYAIRKVNTFNMKTSETEKLIRENLFYYVPTYMGHIAYSVNEKIKQITRVFSEKLKKENLRRAEIDFYDIERQIIALKIKKKIDMIKTLIAGTKMLSRRKISPNQFITESDAKALKTLEYTLMKKELNEYDLDAFTKYESEINMMAYDANVVFQKTLVDKDEENDEENTGEDDSEIDNEG